MREEGRERGRSVLGCDDCDRGREIDAATAIAIGDDESVLRLWSRSRMTNRCCDCDRDRGRRIGARMARRQDRDWWRRIWVEDDRFWGATRAIGFGWIGTGVRRSRRWCDRRNERARSWVFWVHRSRFLGSLEFGLFSLSLSLHAGASPSHSALSPFSGKWVFEGKIKTKINLHLLTGQLKSISGKCIFRA